MSTAAVHHPLFARLFHRAFSGPVERELAPVRKELLAGLSGEVLEVGAGSGLSFRHYPPSVTGLLALEPERYLRAKAEIAARQAPIAVSVRDGQAEALPLQSGSLDAAVVSLVLCSVHDLGAALAELRRVLRAGGQLRFLEHVRSAQPQKARLQGVLDGSGLWPALAGGCHCARGTVDAIEAAGFTIEQIRTLQLGPSWMPTNPVMIGHAHALS